MRVKSEGFVNNNYEWDISINGEEITDIIYALNIMATVEKDKRFDDLAKDFMKIVDTTYKKIR